MKQTVTGGISGVEGNKAGEQVSENVEIVQSDSARGPLDGFRYYPLAFLRPSTDRNSIDEVFQIVHYNIRGNTSKSSGSSHAVSSASS